MERLTTDNPAGNLSALMNYAYASENRVKLSYAGCTHGADLCEYIASEAAEFGLSCAPLPEDVMDGACLECDCVFGVLNNVAIQAAELRARLKAIEDILGDTYDLDHLRELVESDKRPLKPGDEVYWILEDFNGWYVAGPEKVQDVGTKGFYMSDLDDRMCDNPSFYPWDELGKNAFLSRAEAEAALAKMKEEEGC